MNHLEAHAPDGYEVAEGWDCKPRAGEYAPDVMVHPRTEEQTLFTGTPLLCVELLSSNWSDDLVRKVFKHAKAGLPSCWVLDPLEPSLRTFALHGGEDRQTSLITSVGGAPGWPGMTIDVAALLAT